MSDITRETPNFTINLNILKQNFNTFKNNLINKNDIIAYAIKANYSSCIINCLNLLGSYFEVSSFFEFQQLINLGISANKIIINGYISNNEQLKKYISSKALLIVESENILHQLIDLNVPCNIGLRINLDYLKKDDDKFHIKNTRFGIRLDEKIVNIIKNNKKINLICLQSHNSNHTKEPQTYQKIASELCNLIKTYKLNSIQFLNLGGGYKIAQNFYTFKEYVFYINKALIENNIQNISIIYEPGNSLTRTIATYTTKVIDKKIIDEYIYIILDGTKHHISHDNNNLVFPFKIIYKNKNKSIINKQILTGCTCKTFDIFLELINSEELNINDEVIFFETGAYTINKAPIFLIDQPQIYFNK